MNPQNHYDQHTVEKYLIQFFREQSKKKFFGEVTFKFQDGEIKNVAINQSMNLLGFMVVSTVN